MIIAILNILDLILCKKEKIFNFKIYFFKHRYYNDLNDIIQGIVESENTNGKKLIANGTESYSFADIDNMIKQTFCTQTEHGQTNKFMQKVLTEWQLFFHGNCHITNWNFMLNSLQNKNPQFNGYEPATTLVGLKPKSFREYYTQKAETFKEQDKLAADLPELDSFKYPLIQNYWNISLD